MPFSAVSGQPKKRAVPKAHGRYRGEQKNAGLIFADPTAYHLERVFLTVHTQLTSYQPKHW